MAAPGSSRAYRRVPSSFLITGIAPSCSRDPILPDGLQWRLSALTAWVDRPIDGSCLRVCAATVHLRRVEDGSRIRPHSAIACICASRSVRPIAHPAQQRRPAGHEGICADTIRCLPRSSVLKLSFPAGPIAAGNRFWCRPQIHIADDRPQAKQTLAQRAVLQKTAAGCDHPQRDAHDLSCVV